MKKRLEGPIQKDILKYLKAQGVYTVKTMRSNMTGVPDILCCVHGVFLAIEVKAEGKIKNTSPLQKIQLEAILDAEGYILVTDNVQDVKDIIKEIIDAIL